MLSIKKKWNIPVKSGHDLSILSDNELIITGNDNVYVFNIDEETFVPFIPLENENKICKL